MQHRILKDNKNRLCRERRVQRRQRERKVEIQREKQTKGEADYTALRGEQPQFLSTIYLSTLDVVFEYSWDSTVFTRTPLKETE